MRRVFPNLLQVGPHRIPGPIRVTRLDRHEDAFVMELSPLRSSIDFEDAASLFAQQANDRIEQ